MKPSAELVSSDGVVPLVRGNDSPGPIARTVTDAALLLAAIDRADTDYAAALTPDALTGLRVGLLADDIDRAGNLSVALAPTGTILAGLGAEARPVTLQDPTGAMAGFPTYIGAGMRFDMIPYVALRNPAVATLEHLIAYNPADPARRTPFGQNLLETLAQVSAGLSAADRAQMGERARAAATAALEAAFAAQGGVDVLVSMGSLHAPFYATAGYPAITVPVGRGDDGEPVGVTLIGRRGQGARLLAQAFAFEQAARARIAPHLP